MLFPSWSKRRKAGTQPSRAARNRYRPALEILEDRLAPAVVSVVDFGATADDFSDDAPAIQNAIDSLAATGGTVLLPAGTYMLGTSAGGVEVFPDGSPVQSALIVPTDNVTIQGEAGASILMLMPAVKMRAISVTATNVVVDGLVVDGNKAARDGSVPWPNGDVVDALVYGSSTSRNMAVQSCEVRNGIE